MHVRLAPDRGQSESTGVILIVLVAFILGTTVAAFAFTTFQNESSVAPSVAFSYQYQSGDLTVTVESESGGVDEGNGFEGANVVFVCQSGACAGPDGRTWDDLGSTSGPKGRVTAGDSATVSIGDTAELFIRWEEPKPRGKTVILGGWRGPAA